jgi:hypothetical protein
MRRKEEEERMLRAWMEESQRVARGLWLGCGVGAVLWAVLALLVYLVARR